MSTFDLTSLPSTDPLAIYRERDGLYAVDLLGAALVHFDFFTWLAEHPSDKPTLCRELQLVERPADVMLTLFAAMGLVEERAGVFHVTGTAREHLVKSSPWFLGPYYASLKDRPVLKDYISVLKTGRTANWGGFKDAQDWHKAMEDETFANNFTAAMDCRGVYLGAAMAKHLDTTGRHQLLDIAGGSGIYACAIVARHPHLRATVLEKPPVDAVARRAIEKRGLSERVSVIAGDMLAGELPGGFDLHLISNVLHDWDAPVARQILAKSARALTPGGTLVIHDAHINETKTGPLPVAKYSALLMHSTEGKCYSLAEMRGYLGALGFTDFQFRETAVDRSIITVRRPS
ncbi:MAG: methyltransferase domain-containing protein [Verrucomicrobia bacterium]|nr:methyltransferase domain-containing protein [Verrucomicrobiota bacterium]